MIAVTELIEPQPIALPVAIEAPWFVVLTQPQQDITTVWRLHELGLELYVPVIRTRINTRRTGRNGTKLTRIIARPMFPGYGFLRTLGIDDLGEIRDVRGVREFLRDESFRPIMLPHHAVVAVKQKEMQEHHEWLQKQGKKRGSKWKKGDRVRFDDDGGVYAGLVATVDQIDSKGRIELLFGMIRHKVPADMVVAA